MEIPDEVDEVSAAVYDPDGNSVKSTFQKEPDGLYHLRFTPTKIGQYNVSRIRSRSYFLSQDQLIFTQQVTRIKQIICGVVVLMYLQILGSDLTEMYSSRYGELTFRAKD